MKGNKKVSPSWGVCGRLNAANKSILLFSSGRKNLNPFGLRAVLVMLLVVLGIGEMWAGAVTGASSYVKTETAAPAEGLVYCSNSKSANPSQSDYKRYYPGGSGTGSSNASCYVNLGAAKSGVYIYCWAKPARGYEFDHWDGYEKGYLPYGDQNKSKLLDIDSWNGVKDEMVGTCGNGESTYKQHQAYFRPATSYTITYMPPVGGSYSVSYSYLKTSQTTGEEYEFYTDNSESYNMTPTSENASVKSYAADAITLSVPPETDNFIGWYDGETRISTSKTYTGFTADHNATIRAEFKDLAWGDVTGDVTTNVTAKGTYDSRTVYVAIPTLVGSWLASDFTVTPTNTSNSFGSIVIGTVSLSGNQLVIPYTYTATNWGGVEVNITIEPSFGATKEFSIACAAKEVVDYEACIEENDVRTHIGTLADMMTQANSMTNKPVVKLMQDMTITAPLSFTKSMTFDVNGNVLTANCASAFLIDAAGIDVQIIDGSFTQVGEIHTSASSASNVNVVTFTQKAKLTMQGGTLSASNTGSGSAYGVNVCNGSIFYMTNGQLTVSANTGDAHGVHVASASDYATFNGGSLNISAPTDAYGLWSAGQSNITNATINAQTTTTGAYGIYVNGGVSTLEGNTITATAATNNAYGAYVSAAGRLNVNGGSISATAVSSGVYGVHVADGATAMLQMNAVVTAEATGASGTSVFGVNNLGTISLTNVSVTATSPTTAATAVNSATSADSTTIDGGTYRATANGGTAYGLHHQYGTLTVDGGTFRAIGSGNNIYGGRAAANGSIANATLHGETQGTGNTAYGFVGGVAGKNITLSNCTIEGISNTNKAYAIYSRANVSATGCTLTATTKGTDLAYGLYAEDGTNSLTNSNATVTAETVSAYGAYHKSGSLSISGGAYAVTAKQASAAAAQNSQLYGLYNEADKTTTVNGATFTVTAANAAYSQDVYGAKINGILNSSGATYTAEAKLTVYGVWGNTASTLNLSGNTISSRATNGTKSYGVYAKKNFAIDGDIINAVATTTDVYAMFFDASTSDGNVFSGKFSAQGNGTNGYGALNDKGTVGKVKLKGGVYKTTVNLQKYTETGYQIYHLDETHPDYADGYRYIIATENPSPYVCHIVGGAYYATLKEALQYTLDNSGTYTIVMTQPHTLLAGEYVLPANATLIVPRKFGQTTITGTGDPATVDKITTVGLNENFLCLTMASGAHLNVDGKIGVSGEMYCTQSGGISNQSPYGRIHMESGSLIQLNNGSYLYAWGMITGSGSITVKSNAEVREMFQVKNMPSASNLRYYVREYNTSNTTRYMPFNQYSIQNIEVPTTYYYNSRLLSEMRCYYSAMGGTWYGDGNINLIGNSGALFEVTSDDESSWVRKSYDATNKQQVWEVNTAAQLGSISITMTLPIVNQKITISSAHYILPVTNNMKIHVLDGDFAITNDTELMPGASVEINKTASLTVNSEKKLYVFDKDQWSSTTSYADAAINVHGNINVKGALYTTSVIAGGTNATHGANIYSNNADAGTIFFENAAPSATTSIELITGVENSSIVTKTVTMDPALLKNGTGASQAFTPTSGTDDGHAFAYINNEWTQTYTEGCFEIKGEHTYAKPGDYVELKKQREQETVGYDDMFILDNHTYLSIDETRIFIHLLDAEGDCQWWEVEATSDLTVFECKKPGYEGFYYYDNSDSDPDEWTWKLKTVKVKFYAAEEGDAVLKTIVTDFNGVPDQAVIASNPTKETTAAATYQFYGWQSSVSGTTYPWTATLEKATTDMSYRPVFTATPRNYTVTFINANNGANVPVETAYNTHPVCTPDPEKTATAQYTYSFQYWLASDNTTQYAIDAELPAVTGATYYTAVWSSVVNRYTITWMDGETVLETDKHQLYGSDTEYNGTLPTKEPDDNFVYAFSGWRSSLTGQTYTNGTPNVAGETTYEAQYSTTPRYAITFANYDGTQLQKEAVTAGENPIYNGLTPGRVRDLDGYFRFIGWKNSDGTDFAPNATLPAVTGKETYTAQYDYVTELYWITFHNVTGKNDLEDNDDNWSGKFGVESTPYYDPNNDDVADMPTKAGNAQYSYPFTGWTPALEPVSGETTYTAQFGQEINSYDITFANLDGNGASQTIKVEYGQTPVCPVTPTKDDGINSYPFEGWNTPIVAVTGEATYTAQFSSTPIVRQFDITFDLDNGSQVIVPVTYGTTPEWTGETPAKPATAQYTYTFAGWYPEFAQVTGEETYIAQYTETLNSYTVTFMDRGETLVNSTFQYGTTPTKPAEPKAWVDEEHSIAYSFAGWSDGVNVYAHNAIPAVTGDVTYTAQYTEFANLVATVTTSAGVTTPYNSWDGAFDAANGSANCTLKLYKNVTVSTYQTINGNMTIDLNGFEIKRESGNTLFTFSGIALTINDSKGGGRIYLNSSSNSNPIRAVAVAGNGSVTINGGTIEAYSTYNNDAAVATPIYLSSTNAKLYLYDGELISSTSRSGAKAYAVYNSSTSNGSSYIYGGKLHTKTGIFYNGNANRLTIQGGYYNINTNLNTTNFVKAPYYIFNTTGEDKAEVGSDYNYKVAEAYTITFNNWNGTALSTLQKQIVGTNPSYTGATPTKPQDDQYTYAHSGWTPAIVPVEANATYTATFTGTYRDYTIYWQDWDGTSLGTTQVPYDNATRPTHEAPTHADPNCSFVGWKAASNGTVYAADELPRVGENGLEATYIAQYECSYADLVVDSDDEPISSNTEATTTTVTVSGTLEIDPGVTLTTTNLILEASETASGQIYENGTITAEHVYFDWTMNGIMGTVRRTWYAVAVPWEVNAETGILDKSTGRTMVAGRDFDLIYYNGAKRASEGNVASCWEYVQWDIQGHDRQGNQRPVDNLLHPGRLYMMYFAAEGLQTVRFEMKDGAEIRNTADMKVYEYTEGTSNDGKDANWNGIANPRSYYASLEAGNTYAQVLNNGNLDDYFAGENSPVYQTINLTSSTFRVGKPLFVQSTGEETVVVNKATTAGIVNAAPRRNREESATPEGIDAVYELTIAADGKPSSDNLFVQVAEDEKADKYVIGKDLSKGGVAVKRAQMWVDRYNTKLSVNTQTLVNDEATYPLVLFAPAAGEFTISTVQSPLSNEDYDLYLTLNGEAIWNLSNGDYTLWLPQGNTADYGLRISARKSPTVATGIDEAVVDAKGETQKVLINNQVFIIRGNQVYSIDGQIVK